MSGSTLTGSNGASSNAGAPGGTGQSEVEIVSGMNFASSATSLQIVPTVRGGNGGNSSGATAGQAGTSTIQSTANGTLTTWSSGTYGGLGASGGNAGSAESDVTNDTIGSAASFYAGPVSITTFAAGGLGGTGGNGGPGGSTGGTSSSDPANLVTGGRGGDGGATGGYGSGGAATSTVGGLVANLSQGIAVLVDVTGGAGASPLSTFNAATGGNGGVNGAGVGGNGTAGGIGGTAQAQFINNTMVTQTQSITIDVSATGGAGGNGSGGANGGLSIDQTPAGNTSVPGAPGASGAGGAAGAATTSFTGNTLTAGSSTAQGFIDLNLAVASYSPSAGGPDPTNITVISGASGAGAPATTVVTGNTVDLAGDGPPAFGGTSSVLTLTLTNTTLTAPSIRPGGSTAPITNALNGTAGGNLVFSGNIFSGAGNSTLDLAVKGGGVVVNTLNNTISIGGSADNALTGFTIFSLDSADTFVWGSGAYTVTVSADPDTLVFTPGHGGGLIYNATTADAILDFSGYGSALDSLAQLQADTTTNSAGNTVIAIAGDGTITLSGTLWTPTAADASFATACFATGTRIQTARGAVCVEELQPGDQVETHTGTFRPVVWIGHRRVDCRHHPHAASVRPVRIAAGAFGPGASGTALPLRPLVLSPDHAVFIDGVLIRVGALVDGAAISQPPCDVVTYWHVELDSHAILLAEGLPAESYLDTGNRHAFANAGMLTMLHPRFDSAGQGEAVGAGACAPLVGSGPLVEAVRARLRLRLSETRAQIAGR